MDNDFTPTQYYHYLRHNCGYSPRSAAFSVIMRHASGAWEAHNRWMHLTNILNRIDNGEL